MRLTIMMFMLSFILMSISECLAAQGYVPGAGYVNTTPSASTARATKTVVTQGYVPGLGVVNVYTKAAASSAALLNSYTRGGGIIGSGTNYKDAAPTQVQAVLATYRPPVLSDTVSDMVSVPGGGLQKVGSVDVQVMEYIDDNGQTLLRMPNQPQGKVTAEMIDGQLRLRPQTQGADLVADK